MIGRLATAVRRLVRAVAADQRGGMALMTAIALPPLLLIAVGAVELQGVASDQAATQNVADQAAIWGAKQLGVAPIGIEARTESWASPQLQGVLARADVTVHAEVKDGALMQVAIDTHRPSFFFSLMPAGGFHTHAVAMAQSINRLPLCVLTFGSSTSNQAELKSGALIKAPGCMVHAKGDIAVDGQATLIAGAVETESSKAQGSILPAAGTDAPPVPDPFAAMPIAFPAPCSSGPDITVTQANPVTLAPPAGQSWMVVQGKVTFDTSPANGGGGGTLTLMPGEYYFCQDVTVTGGPQAQALQGADGPASKRPVTAPVGPLSHGLGMMGLALPPSPPSGPPSDTATLIGDDVTLVFADGRKLTLNSGSSLTLNGRKAGPLAGFVLVAGLGSASAGAFPLNSDQIQSLLGTVYVRNTPLEITGQLQMASASAWTVIVANSLLLDQTSPGVLMNANYSSSSVVRPAGVGDAGKSVNARLVR